MRRHVRQTDCDITEIFGPHRPLSRQTDAREGLGSAQTVRHVPSSSHFISIYKYCFRARLAKNEEDKLDKLDPTVRYLQKLGPDHLDLILREADWIFKEDPVFGLRVSVRHQRKFLITP